MTRITNHDDRSTAALFGDGAGAVVLTAGGPGAIGPVILGTAADPHQAIIAHRHEGFLRMDGHHTFKTAVTNFAHGAQVACEAAGITTDDIDVFAFHQANGRILTAVAERLEIPHERVLRSVEHHGNTSAASIPLALADAQAAGTIPRPGRVALAAVGAGFTWAGAVLDFGAGS
jgi:3-oxoacyl-[acyl-carrier-protein] synthase-3